MVSDKQRFIVDEWLWHDVRGENGEARRAQAFRFLETLNRKCDMIVTLKRSPFEQKFFETCEHAETRTRAIVRFFWLVIYSNKQKYLTVEDDECSLPPEGIPAKPDDLYLVRLAASGYGTVITSDHLLMQILQERNIPCVHRDELLGQYTENG